jgi:hypothetical protein
MWIEEGEEKVSWAGILRMHLDLPTGMKMAAIIRSAAITHVGSKMGFHALSLCCRRARSGGRLAPGITSEPCGMVARAEKCERAGGGARRPARRRGARHPHAHARSSFIQSDLSVCGFSGYMYVGIVARYGAVVVATM